MQSADLKQSEQIPIKMGDIENGMSIDYDDFKNSAPKLNFLGDDQMSITKLMNEGKCLKSLKNYYRLWIAAS